MEEIIFTSGATEANHLAICGAALDSRTSGGRIGSGEPSQVLAAIGPTRDQARATLRLVLGRTTTEKVGSIGFQRASEVRSGTASP